MDTKKRHYKYKPSLGLKPIFSLTCGCKKNPIWWYTSTV